MNRSALGVLVLLVACASEPDPSGADVDAAVFDAAALDARTPADSSGDTRADAAELRHTDAEPRDGDAATGDGATTLDGARDDGDAGLTAHDAAPSPDSSAPSEDAGIDSPGEMDASFAVADASEEADAGTDAALVAEMDAWFTRDGDVTDAAPDPVDGGPSCATARGPSVATTVGGSSTFYWSEWPVTALTRTGAVVVGPFGTGADTWRSWYRWNGSGWTFEPMPWPSDVVVPVVSDAHSLVDRRVIFLYQSGSATRIGTWDGTVWDDITLPSEWAAEAALVRRAPDGTYYVLCGRAAAYTLRSGDGVSWSLPVAAPFPASARFEIMLDGRPVFAYATTYDAYVSTGAADGTWTTQNLTSGWASDIEVRSLALAPARDGGLVAAVTAHYSTWFFPYFFRSADGVTWGAGERMSSNPNDQVRGLDADCLDRPIAVLHAGYRTGPRIARRVATDNWPTIAGPPGWPNGSASAVVSPGGGTFWAYDQSNEAVTSFSVTMSGSP